MREQYPSAIIIDDIGSGINWKRKGLQSIIKQVIDEDVGSVVIHHRDRLCRFAYELIAFFFQQFGTKIVVLDQETYQPNLDDLEDKKVFNCSQCDYKADRDENAAFNILRFVINTALPVLSVE
jgi:predicted site-specific integrase-resolvase